MKEETNTVDDTITYKIRGCAYNVYKNLGPGLLESVYEEALTYELQKEGLDVKRQCEVPINYDGVQLPSNLRLDLLVDDRIIVELKSVLDLSPIFFKQLYTYLKMCGLDTGLLINFNVSNILDGMKRVRTGSTPKELDKM
jgi:GxxExxY protein